MEEDAWSNRGLTQVCSLVSLKVRQAKSGRFVVSPCPHLLPMPFIVWSAARSRATSPIEAPGPRGLCGGVEDSLLCGGLLVRSLLLIPLAGLAICGSSSALNSSSLGDDCNGNGVLDAIDVANGTSEDCDRDGVPDECEMGAGDQDHNGVLDDCELNCVRYEKSRTLTGNDTLTLLTSADNPEQQAGYAYAYALDRALDPGGFDVFIGQMHIIDGIHTWNYAVNALDFRAGVGHRKETDIDGDGHRDLNGSEYEMAPNELLVPRFFGQSDPSNPHGVFSDLVLIALSGGSYFETTVDFLVYNDNEEMFSTEHTFSCWDKVALGQISGVFSQAFLRDQTNHDPDEVFGDPTLETGWFRMSGGVASSTARSIQNPAIYGVLLERAGRVSVGDAPFEIGGRAGHLSVQQVVGDNEEWGGVNAYRPEIDVQRRRPGSLIMWPEFDNRDGVASIMTLTNVSSEDVHVQFVYTGRWQQL